MNSLSHSGLKIARVAIDVRLYFDVRVESAAESKIARAAIAELKDAEDAERILIGQLSHSAVFPKLDLSRLKPKDITICDVSDE